MDRKRKGNVRYSARSDRLSIMERERERERGGIPVVYLLCYCIGGWLIEITSSYR